MQDRVSHSGSGAGRHDSWPLWAAQIVGLLFGVFVLVSDVGTIFHYLHLDDGGSSGMSLTYDSVHDHWFPTATVKPGGAAAVAGIVSGDEVRFDSPPDSFRSHRAGEAVGLTVRHGARSFHTVIVPRAWSAAPIDAIGRLLIVYDFATMAATLFGAFIIWRSGRKPTTLALGAGLTCYGLIRVAPCLWLSGDPTVFFLATAAGYTSLTIIPVLFYAFALGFNRDHGGGLARWEIGLFGAYAAIQVFLGLTFGWLTYINGALPLIGTADGASTAVAYVGFAMSMAYLFRGWRKGAADVQQRYALMLIATSAIVVAQSLDLLSQNVSNSDAFDIFHAVANSILTGVVASGLFTYSIFRHRVFDLGFAVNRTLVYGVVSAILLVGFGLVEWASDHFLPIAGLEKNAIVDAAVALAIFLTFHRLRDAVEHAIESLFFRAWREKEAALKTFVGEAAYILKPKALTHAFVHALVRFADGAPVAVYLRDETGQYARREGQVAEVPALIDPDHPAVVALRARRAALEHEALPDLGGAELALPMVNRAEVMGFVVVGAKPSALAFRPDEVELLSWAVNQVGLDLHTLRIEHLEAIAAEQRQEIALLRAGGGLQAAAG